MGVGGRGGLKVGGGYSTIGDGVPTPQHALNLTGRLEDGPPPHTNTILSTRAPNVTGSSE